ncbi:MAG: hypothetical protein GWO82_05025 [Bacteroidetes bacterium]|nr:hypothetical protein [Bacteroidota bacterium]
MKLFKVTVVLVTLSILISCGTSKGYVGDKISTNELAILNGSVNSITIDGKKHKERVFFVKVNQREVGSYGRGWPKNLKVKEGKNEIEVRHFRPWEYDIGYTGGGAIGGMQAGLDNERTMNHHHYILKFVAKQNNNYLINIKSDPSDFEKVNISILNVTTNEEINFESEKKITNRVVSSIKFNTNANIDDLGNGNVLIFNGANRSLNFSNSKRVSVWIDDKLVGHFDPQEYLILSLEKQNYNFNLLHVDFMNFESEHSVDIEDETRIIMIKPTAFSNKLQVTNELPKHFGKFKKVKEK